MTLRLQQHVRHLVANPLRTTGITAIRTMSTIQLPPPNASVRVHIPAGDPLNRTELLNFPAFSTWLTSLTHSLALQKTLSAHPFHDDPYSLKSITIQAIDRFGGNRLGFLKLKAEVKTADGQSLPGSIFLRGGAVVMLLILACEEDPQEQYVLMTKQPRISAGSLDFLELPAGMIDDSGTFGGAAAKEIEEECGLKIPESELVDLTKLAAEVQAERQAKQAEQGDVGAKELLQQAMYTSPGGSDEFIAAFMHRKAMKREEIEKMKGRLTGLRDHGEKITLKVVKLEDLWWEGRGDAKTLGAWALYQGLKADGSL